MSDNPLTLQDILNALYEGLAKSEEMIEINPERELEELVTQLQYVNTTMLKILIDMLEGQKRLLALLTALNAKLILPAVS